MIKDPLKQWAKSELERLEREEKREKTKIAYEEMERIKREIYLNAPVMNLEGKVFARNSLSRREKDEL